MFERKPLKKSTISQVSKTPEVNAPANNQKMYMYAAIGLGVVAVILFFLFLGQKSKTSAVTQQARAMSVKIKELESPKYDLMNDFITDQCGTDGVYCMDVVTKNPGIEILKFLVNFRENPELKYSLFFQVDADPNAPTAGYKLDCEPRKSDFYICQQITTARPTDVIRAFQRSYSSFTPSVNYSFTLMVKPIGHLEMPNQVTVTPPPMKTGEQVATTTATAAQPNVETASQTEATNNDQKAEDTQVENQTTQVAQVVDGAGTEQQAQ